MKMNLDHLRGVGREGIKDNSLAINVTPGVNQYGQSYSYGKGDDAEPQNNAPTSLNYNGEPKLP